jgi:hypothetical protein
MADTKISALTAATTPLAGTEVLPIVQSATTVKASIANIQAAPVSAGTANGVVYLNASKVPTTGTDLVYDATNKRLGVGIASPAYGLETVGQIGCGDNLAFTTANPAIVSTSGYLRMFVGGAERQRYETSGDITISTGNVVIGTSGKGIDFSATPGTGTSELLADYEEGTFTPAITGSTSVGTGTYSTQLGIYTRVGNMVRFNIEITWSAHTGTGDMGLAGLPFTASSTGGLHPISILSSNLTVPLNTLPAGMVISNSSSITFYTMPTTGTSASVGLLPLDTAATLWICGTYIV